MDTSWNIYQRDASRTVEVIRHPTASLSEVLKEIATDAIDLSAFVVRCTQSAQEVQVEFGFHHELYGDGQPKIGEVLELRLNGQQLAIVIIDAINDYKLSRGERRLSITARSRDASPLWREVPRVTPLYPVATPIDVIANDIADQLDEAENLLPTTTNYTVHSGTQLANISAWSMLTTIYQPGGLEPYVDARGRLKCISRDVTREPDVVLTEEQVLNITASKARYPVTAVKVKWLDPKLHEVKQQDKVLDQANIHAGYFQLKQEQDMFWSADHTQRAKNTRMVIKQSCNSGLARAASEDYEQLTQTQGRITLTTEAWVPALISAYVLVKIAQSEIPDFIGWGVTIPYGRVVQAVSDMALMLVMVSVGTGSYEIWGEAYDFIHTRNTSEAYDPNAPTWLEKKVEIENDFVMDEAGAKAFAIRELIYAVKSAQSYGVTIVDSPGLEHGDIIQLADGSRIYVTGYSRSLGRGEPATLQVSGFRCA